MHEAFLLRAVYRIITGIEIGHQHASEPLQNVLRGARLPALAEREGDFLMVRKHPDIPLLQNEVGPRFVSMYQRAAHDLLEKTLVCAFVTQGCTCLQAID